MLDQPHTALSDEVSGFVDEWKTVDAVFLDFSKIFSSSHNAFVGNLTKYRQSKKSDV